MVCHMPSPPIICKIRTHGSITDLGITFQIILFVIIVCSIIKTNGFVVVNNI